MDTISDNTSGMTDDPIRAATLDGLAGRLREAGAPADVG